MSQRKPDTTIEVDLDISELEVSSAETKATYEEIKSYVLKKFGLNVSNLYIVKPHFLSGADRRLNSVDFFINRELLSTTAGYWRRNRTLS